MKKNIFKALMASCVIISMTGCLKKDKLSDPKIPIWKPDLAIPLVNSDLSLKDLISESQDGKTTISTDPDGLYVITYRDTAFSDKAEDVIVIPDQIKIIPLFTATNTPEPLLLDFDFNNPNNNNFQGTLTKAELKEGSLSLDLTTNNVSSFNVILTFPTILKKSDGSAFTITKNTGGNLTFSLTGNLTGYDVNFSPNNKIDFTIGISNMIGIGTLTGTLNITNIKYNILYGTYSTIPLGALYGSNDVSIFQDILTGGIHFEDPSVTFTFDNYFGVPITSDFIYFRTIDAANNTTDMDAGDIEGTNLIQQAPTVGGYASTTFQVNSTNSTTGGGKQSLKDALSTSPKQIEYSLNPTIDNNSTGFVKDDSRVKIAGELRIPFYGSITNYALQDTFDIEFDSFDNVDYVEFDINTENKIPVELSLQIYFVDTSNAWIRLDSFFVDSKPILKAPQVDNNGVVVSAGVNQLISSFNKADLMNLKGTNKLLINASMKTPNAPAVNVKFFDSNNLHIKISARAKVNIDVN